VTCRDHFALWRWLGGPLLLGLSAWSCGERASAPAGGKLTAFVTIPPLAFLAERVGGARVAVEVLVRPGQSPHTYEPTMKQMVALGDAQLYFSIGMPFEEVLLARVSQTAKTLRIVDVREGVPMRRMAEEEAEHSAEGEAHGGHDHAAGAPDPHCWLAPSNAKIIAANMCRGFKEEDPSHAAEYERNLKALQGDLDAADAKLRAALAPLKGKEFMAFHPAYGYLADAYGLRQVAVEVEGKEPSSKHLVALINRARKQGVKVIFVQPQFSTKSAEAIATAIGGTVVALDPLAHDYIRNLEEMAQKIKDASF